MDTKSKNIKYRLGTKIVAVIILWVSLVGSLGSGFFLLLNSRVIMASSHEESYEYKAQINRLTHNTVELGTKFKHGKNKGLDPKRYKVIENNLSNTVNFNYYMRDIVTGEVSYKVSGYNPEKLKDVPGAVQISINEGSLEVSKNDQTSFWLYESNDIEKMLIDAPQELYIVINNPPVPGDAFYTMFSEYTIAKTYIPYAIGTFFGSLILFIASLGYLILVSGRKEKDGEVFLTGIDKIYNDIQSFFVLVAAGVSISIIASIDFRYERYDLGIIAVVIIFAIDATIGMTYFFSMLRQFKKGMLLKNTLIYKLFDTGTNIVRSLFNEKIFSVWIVGLILVYAFVNGVLFSYATSGRGRFGFGSLLIIGFNLIAVYFVFKRLKSLTLIMNAAKEISNGSLTYQIDQSEISMEFESFAQDIQSIQGGLKNAVSEAIKGEKMKTDLITNVSHDLKTPLTSIINYVDLLKQEEINNDTAIGYLEILDEKSYRLKQLIEDLIEASKASSGNLVVTKEEVDLHELVIQACGEYEEKIEKTQLDIRINTPKEKILILADGKYMWRIIENIMSNALKYSMANSRIYIDIERRNGLGVLTMKNVSAYPLDIDPAQLTERFTRADESRTTEGSGLGLSIAQSLTNIQNGRFNIEIDGDLFKVIVEMPLGTVHS